MSLTKEQVVANWPEICRKFPIICGLKTFNAELTIYATLQQAYKQFDWIVITDDGSTDNTIKMIEKCVTDYGIKNIEVYQVGEHDPWPDQKVEKREGDHHIIRNGDKTAAKACFKNWSITKQKYPNFFYLGLEDDVILFDNVRQRIYERISKWSDPFTDCEYFNVSSIVDKDHVLLALHEGKPLPGIKQRALYDNAGDWTCALFWNAGQIQIGPDPVYPFGACMFPWLPKTQVGKKGQDTSMPFGFHMINYRKTKVGFCYNLDDPGLVRITDLGESGEGVDFDLLNRVWFPEEIVLEKTDSAWVQKIKESK